MAAVGKMQVRFAGRRICRAPQQGSAQDQSGPEADLGRAESRHPEAGKQQGLQQKEVAELEAGATANRSATFSFMCFLYFDLALVRISYAIDVNGLFNGYCAARRTKKYLPVCLFSQSKQSAFRWTVQ